MDQLPDTPENLPIREISDLYGDAVAFGITRLTGVVSQPTVAAAQTKYQSEGPRFIEELGKMDPDLNPSQHARGMNRIIGELVSKILIVRAGQRLAELK